MFIELLPYIKHCLLYDGEQDRLDSYAQGKDTDNKKETKSTKTVNGNQERYEDIR